MNQYRRISRFFSYIFHPLLLGILSAVIINISAEQSILLGLRNVGILVLTLLPGVIYLLVNKWQAKQTHHHELFLMLPGLVVFFVSLKLLNAPTIIAQTSIIGILVMALATLINRYWDISFHAAMSMSGATILLLFSSPLALAMALMSIVAGVSRLPIQEHTFLQVLVGWLYGFGVTFGLLFLLQYGFTYQ